MHWYHTQEVIELQTPTRNDGVDFETEARYRKEGARFIMELGNKLGLRYLTMASGIVFFHRFYMFHSFKEFSRWVTGATCLFLAGKVEETPKKCRDILKVAQQSLSDHQFKTFGENPREEVMICERILLQTIKFDLQLSHPYQYLIRFGKLLKGDKSKINELVQKAWIFINDSLSTTLCLIYQPQVVALAVLLLALRLSNQNIKDLIAKPRVDWWKEFYPEAEETELEEICKELTNMYEGKPPKRRFPHRHVEKVKSGSQNNTSPQPGSPHTKKQKLTTTPQTCGVAATTSSTSIISSTSSTTTSVVSSTGNIVTQSKESKTPKKIDKVSVKPSSMEKVSTSHSIPPIPQTSQGQLNQGMNISSVGEAQHKPEQQHRHTAPLPSEQITRATTRAQNVLQQPFHYSTNQLTPQKQRLLPVSVQQDQYQTTMLQNTQQTMPTQMMVQQPLNTSQMMGQQSINTGQMMVQQPINTVQMTDVSAHPPAPILDHMSSFFNPSYSQFSAQPMPPPTFGPFPTLPTLNSQPTTANFSQPTMPIPHFGNMAPLPPHNPFLDSSNATVGQTFSFPGAPPPMMMQPPNMQSAASMQAPPGYRGVPWMQQPR